jgi:ADP-heptose:LPS heptosyltransferase
MNPIKVNLPTDRANDPATLANKTICIIQLARIGDLIQTLQAAINLKAQHPEIRLILVAREQFARPLDFLLKQTFDHCYYLNYKKIFERPEAVTLTEARNNLNVFLKQINDENISVAVNFSFSKSSSYLTTLVHAKHYLGMYRRSNGELVINDKWSQYVYASVMTGGMNPYSLVDIFQFILGGTPTSPIREQKKFQGPVRHIVLHPFASHNKKRWKTNKWSEIIYRVLKSNPSLKISIVGAKTEAAEAQALLQLPLINTVASQIEILTGRTTLEELFELLKKSDLFVGHDSMVGHLASLLKKPSFTISLGTVRPIETTPYAVGTYNIFPKTKCFPCFPSDPCELYKCHADIPYPIICSAIQQLIDHQDINVEYMKSEHSCFHLDSVHLCKTVFTANGLLDFEDVLINDPSLTEIYRLFYRLAWLFLFEEKEENHPCPKLNVNLHKALLQDLNGLQHLFELFEFGKKYSRYILEEVASKIPNIAKIKEYGKKIEEIDQLQVLLKKSFPALSPIVDQSIVSKANLKGISIVELTESAYISYEQSSSLTRVIYELAQNSIAEYKHNNTKEKQSALASR